jgi:large conductance mechanosensitive channel
MIKDFKAFIMRGNVVDLAVGVIIGAAFGSIVKSLVDDVMMPVLGLLTGGIDFSNMYVLLKAGAKAPAPYSSLADARAAGAVTVNYGVFINSVIAFLIVAFCVFMVVQAVAKLHKAPPPAPANTKDCPYCKRPIPKDATRCPECTSQLTAAA